jgi:hypothetical protein
MAKIIEENDSRSNEEKSGSTENCIGAVGKILF